MQVGHVNVVYIFLFAVTRMPHIANHLPRRHHASFLQILTVREILPQMRIVIITLPVKTADSKPPAAILVPADSLHITGFYGNDWSAYRKLILNIFTLKHMFCV